MIIVGIITNLEFMVYSISTCW